MADNIWSDFKDGKVYLRVEREDWDAFIEKCERDGLRSRSGRRASEFNPLRGYSHIFISHNLRGAGDGLGWDRPDDLYHKTCGLPIHKFKSMLGGGTKEGDSSMAHTFKVGDIVRGISDIYAITDKGMTRGKVVSVKDSDIAVEVLEHARGCRGTYSVCAQHFEPVSASLISRTLYNQPATVVFWSDGSKTVAKCAPHEQYDCEKGLAIACAKKLLGAGYAEAFKEFRDPANRVLTRDEVCALKIGDTVWVEDCGGHESAIHKVDVHLYYNKILQDKAGRFYAIGWLSTRFNSTWRVWLLPRKPTAAELAANPWPKREG